MSAVTRISPAEAHAKMKDEGFTYVDVRTEGEFAEGHPEGAVNVPFLRAGGEAGALEPNPEFVEVMKKRFAPDARIVLGCKSGGRSLRAAEALLGAGFTQMLEQRAGWDGARGAFGEVQEPGWSRAGLPVERGAPEGRSYDDVRRG